MQMMSHPQIKVPHSRGQALFTALLFNLLLNAKWMKLLDKKENCIKINCFYQVTIVHFQFFVN